MRITEYTRVEHTLEVSEKNTKLITKSILQQLIQPGEYLRTDSEGIVWLKQDDPDHRHGSIHEEIVRKATELDKAVFLVLEALN